MRCQDLAVCIRAVDYSETSQIVTFFARDTGKFTAIAKGSKRPKSAFDGPIELFAHGQIVYAQSHREKLATLTEFRQEMPFSFLTRNLFALHCASFAAELVHSGTDDYDPHPQLFDAFIKLLQDLEQTQSPLRALIVFQLTLLKEIGLMPVLDHCANCKARYERRAMSDEFYFSSSANGLVCRDCEPAFPDKTKLSPSTAKALADKNELARADEKTLRQIEKVLIAHFTELLHKPPRTAKYVLAQ